MANSLPSKEQLRTKILEELERQLQVLEKAVAVVAEGATHDDAKSEGKYDTRAIESSYLAGAQNDRIRQLKSKLSLIRDLELRAFQPTDEIAATALVSVEEMGEARTYFIIPHVAGIKVDVASKVVWVISPESPVGQSILELTAGASYSYGARDGVVKEIG